MTTQAPATGPFVYLEYDQAALDAAYDQLVYAPNRDQIHRRHTALSAAALARRGAPQRFAYGPSAVEYLDVFAAPQPNAPILFFTHGGAWKSTTTIERFTYFAEPFNAAGVTLVLPEFTGVDEAGGRLLTMAEQLRRALTWVAANASRFGADAHRIHLAGHSSGAHLTSTLLLVDWAAHGVDPGAIRSALCCSGMYDLHPVSLSKRSSYVRFDAETIDELSALRHLDRITVPLIVAYGSEETPEFKRQAEAFVAALREAGKPPTLLYGEGYNHFELIETLANPYGLVGRAALAQIAAGTGT